SWRGFLMPGGTTGLRSDSPRRVAVSSRGDGGNAAALGFAPRAGAERGRGGPLRLAGGSVGGRGVSSPSRPRFSGSKDALSVCGGPETMRDMEAGPVTDVVDIQTSTRTFFAGGLATHNSYARPSHEYLGFSAGLDIERRIMVKEDAPALLRQALSSPRWVPQVVALSGNTDAYQPVERRLGITRRCLEVFAEFRNPVGIVTKSALVARDADLLAELARHGAAHVCCSVTTLDPDLARRMEPRAAQPAKRLEAIATLASAGVPVAVLIGPVIPGLNDSEIPRILAAAAKAGAISSSWVLLRLPRPIDELFMRWLKDHVPERRDRVLHRIQDTRDGRLSDSAFGRRKRGQGQYATQIAALIAAAARKHRLDTPLPPLNAPAFPRPPAVGGGVAGEPAVAARRLTAARWLVLNAAVRWSCVVLVALVVGGCGMRKEERHVRTVESNLAAAGFRTIPADTADKRSALKNLP